MKMKPKKNNQIDNKKRHLKQLKLNRKSPPILERKIPTKIEKPTILIVCEGKNTEPSYFNQFKLSTATIKCKGIGFNTVSLVDRTIEFKKETKYDQVWCVFDKDGFTDEKFKKAIDKAENNEIKTAYSNQAFEYWLMLHFNDHQGGKMDRTLYNVTINNILKPFNVTYDGNGSKIISEDFFEILNGIDSITGKERKILAIQRAKNILNNCKNLSPAKAESSTTVYKLVEEILKYL